MFEQRGIYWQVSILRWRHHKHGLRTPRALHGSAAAPGSSSSVLSHICPRFKKPAGFPPAQWTEMAFFGSIGPKEKKTLTHPLKTRKRL